MKVSLVIAVFNAVFNAVFTAVFNGQRLLLDVLRRFASAVVAQRAEA